MSGVSCLLSDPKYTRGMCVPQAYGGLRCHTPYAPMLMQPMAQPTGLLVNSTMAMDPAGGGVGGAAPTAEESSWCLYGPEEDTSMHPICEFVLPAEE